MAKSKASKPAKSKGGKSAKQPKSTGRNKAACID